MCFAVTESIHEGVRGEVAGTHIAAMQPFGRQSQQLRAAAVQHPLVASVGKQTRLYIPRVDTETIHICGISGQTWRELNRQLGNSVLHYFVSNNREA